MRDLGKMAELKFEAPLAQFEDEWGPIDFQSSVSQANLNLKAAINDTLSLTSLKENLLAIENNNNNLNNNNIDSLDNLKGLAPNVGNLKKLLTKDTVDNFNETFSGSLEDLVHSFGSSLHISILMMI